MDEWLFVSRFVAAPPEQLVRLLAGATPEEQGALGAYLGAERLQQLRQLAVQAAGRKNARGSVVFVPGFLGSALVVTREVEARTVWLDHEAIRLGWFRWLRLSADGRLPFDPGIEVRPGGVRNEVYAETLLKLAAQWDVRAFAYDWRKDMAITAVELDAFIRAEFGGAKIQLVAHSTGALVVRAMLAQRTGSAGVATQVERLITLGEPAAGTFVVPRILGGIDPIVERLGCWTAVGQPGQTDVAAGQEAAKAFASFPALYQMLPQPDCGASGTGVESERRNQTIQALYDPQTYGPCPVVVPEAHLKAARTFQCILNAAMGDGSIDVVAIEGYGQPTPVGIVDLKRIIDPDAYELDLRGDGVVPSAASALESDKEAKRYFVAATHGGLASDAAVLAALDELLMRGSTSRLGTKCPIEATILSPELHRGGPRGEDSFARSVRRLVAREIVASRDLTGSPALVRLRAAADRVSPDEGVLEEMLAGSFHTRELESTGLDGASGAASRVDTMPRIGVSLVHAGIESVHRLETMDVETALLRGFSGQRFLAGLQACPIDAIAVGHYLGVLPQGPELALDRSLSRALRERALGRIRESSPNADVLLREEGTILTQFTERGILRGELGQPFFLVDPRPGADRIIVIAGMGVAGRFGAPELTVLVRELCWSLGRLGKRHLATVTIGSGKGNMPMPDAIRAWMRGIGQALSGIAGQHPHLERITFVECEAGRVEQFDRALGAEVDRLAQELVIEYTPKTPEELEAIRTHARKTEGHPRHDDHAAQDGARSSTRVSVQVDGETYRFGAITSTASIPERRIPLRRWLVEAANGELAGEADPALQLDRGQFLGHLLIPDDLRPQFFTRDPLVLMLDASTARIHWEMMAQSEADFSPGARPSGSLRGASDARFPEEYFLGTARGLTRQLRTTFAPPPEPPPPPRRVLRVLVVADPAGDAPLPGALDEGAKVADLFEAFNAVDGAMDNRAEVVRLLGPGLATATNVLRELMSRPYDVFHFAGHCFFDPDNPPASGWLFTGGEILSADLLTRIDRVPKFVFSNACESGVTPDRPEGYSRDMAPSFAEAFFQRGVANFICTAWPVDDLAARRFAIRLYQGLLGLRFNDGQSAGLAERIAFEPMYRAMLEARLAIAQALDGTGARTWGAYQHYGDPHFRFFHGRGAGDGYRPRSGGK